MSVIAAAAVAISRSVNVSNLRGMASAAAPGGPVERSIVQKLQSRFAPLQHLEVLNESSKHNVPAGSETHFKVLVVADAFSGMSPLQRHRAVNETLAEDLQSGVHALSIVARTAAQWEEEGCKGLEGSPACRGGFGK
jgi:BolA protein